MKNFYYIIICCVLGSLELQAQTKHEVKEGETLSGLAKQYYKDIKKWKPIFDANKGRKLKIAINPKTKKPYIVPTLLVNPNLVYPGQVFRIPNIDESDNPIFCDFGGLKLKEKLEGTWNVKKGNLLFEEGSYLKIEKGGKLYLYNEDLYAKKDWIDIGKWEVKDKSIIFSLVSEEVLYQINEEAIAKRKFGSYQLDENGKKSEELEMIKAYPPPKVTDITGRVFFNDNPLEGVIVSGGGRIDTTDASGNYTLKVREGTEIKLSKKNYHSMSRKVENWELEDVSLEREEIPITSRIFSGVVWNEKEKAAKGTKIILELNQQQFGPYKVNKGGTWQSEAIPFTWEQIETKATYQIIYKKQEKIIEIPETLTEKVDLGKVIFEKE